MIGVDPSPFTPISVANNNLSADLIIIISFQLTNSKLVGCLWKGGKKD